MALAETISRKVHKLGLVPKAIKLLPVISFLLAVASVSWLLSLPLDGNYRNTYISENALMPSQVTSYFRESEWNIVRGYRGELEFLEQTSNEQRNLKMEKWLNDIGLVTAYHHNGFTKDTLYAIMHAPRGDDTEAMVLTVPWITSEGEYNLGALALAAALARYFSRMSIWSKNIIFVFPEDSHAALRSWVAAYHTSLENTAGSIEAAIVLEYGKNGDYFDYYEMFYEGLNGQLPNLDLLNTANLIGYHEGLHCSIQGTPGEELTKNTYFTRLRTLVRGIVALTLSGLRRNVPGCESFSGWQIQAITIRAKGSKGPHDVTQFGRVVDSTFRSVNNLLEKFHQSFFFYLMLSSKNFVSIATYLPSAVFLAVSFALSSLGCLLNSGVEASEFVNNIGRLLTIFTLIELGGFMLSLLLPLLTINTPLELQDEVVLQILLVLSIFTFILALSPLTLKKQFKFFKLNKPLTFGLISLSLFFISMLITTLLIVHFSLALLVGFLSLPLTFVQPIITQGLREKSARALEEDKLFEGSKKDPLSQIVSLGRADKAKIKVSLLLIISSPFFVIFLAGSYFDPENGVSLMRGLLTSWSELQCWTWYVVILGWFPAWLGIALSCVFGNFEVDYSAAFNDTKKEI
ncbi:Gaa1-like protein [Scheffersomyces xylosifermentans]|uniref:Gaa1-like protein n=1 Tax=Scheffersomyces xylosifermentans TaxID=1304137 RepID=UPI00315D435C